MLRLVYLLVDDLDPGPDECLRIGNAIEAAAAGLVSVRVQPIEIGLGHYYESHVALAMTGPGVLHAVLENQSADAIILGCFGDPNLRAAREISSVPVIGGGEASLIAVQHFANRFGIVHIQHTNIAPCEDQIAMLGLGHRCVGMSAIDVGFDALLDDPGQTLDLLIAHGEKLVEQGAEALILGCMSLGLGPFTDELTKRLAVPVINPVRAAVAAAQMHSILGVTPIPNIQEPEHLSTYLPALAAASSAAGLRGWRADRNETRTETP